MPKTDDPYARMSTIIAVLHHKMDFFFWTGFYFLKNDKLVVGQYQGPVACQELAKDTGVCWAGINQAKTVIVDDVSWLLKVILPATAVRNQKLLFPYAIKPPKLWE